MEFDLDLFPADITSRVSSGSSSGGVAAIDHPLTTPPDKKGDGGHFD